MFSCSRSLFYYYYYFLSFYLPPSSRAALQAASDRHRVSVRPRHRRASTGFGGVCCSRGVAYFDINGRRQRGVIAICWIWITPPAPLCVAPSGVPSDGCTGAESSSHFLSPVRVTRRRKCQVLCAAACCAKTHRCVFRGPMCVGFLVRSSTTRLAQSSRPPAGHVEGQRARYASSRNVGVAALRAAG